MAVVNPSAVRNHTLHASAYDLNIHPTLQLTRVGQVSSKIDRYVAKVSFCPSAIAGAPKFEAEIPLQSDSRFNAIRLLHGLGEHFKKAKDPAEFHKMVQTLLKGRVVMQIATTDKGYNLEFHSLNQEGTKYEKFSTDVVKVTGDQHKQMERLMEADKAQNIQNLPEVAPNIEVIAKRKTAPHMTANVTIRREEKQTAHPEVVLTQVAPKSAAEVAAERRKEEERLEQLQEQMEIDDLGNSFMA